METDDGRKRALDGQEDNPEDDGVLEPKIPKVQAAAAASLLSLKNAGASTSQLSNTDMVTSIQIDSSGGEQTQSLSKPDDNLLHKATEPEALPKEGETTEPTNGTNHPGNGQVVVQQQNTETVTLAKADWERIQAFMAQFRHPTAVIPIGAPAAQTSAKVAYNGPIDSTNSPSVITNNSENVSLAPSIDRNNPHEHTIPSPGVQQSGPHDTWNYAAANDERFSRSNERSYYDPRMTVKVPEFSGKEEDYLSWKNRFRTIVFPRKEPESLKFMMLLDCTNHLETLKHFKHWEGTAHDMEEAFRYMDTIYGNPTQILEAMMVKLNAITRVYKEDQVKDLMNLQAHLDAIVTTARKLGRLDLYRIRISDSVMTRLPRTYVEQICKEDKTDLPAVETIQQILKANLDIGMRSVRFFQSSSKNEVKTTKKPNRVGSHHVETSEMSQETSDERSKSSERSRCPYDGGNHDVKACTLSHAQKMTAVRRKGLCLICLRRGHIASACWTNTQCERCEEGRHHETICFQQARKQRQNHQESNGEKTSGSSAKSVGTHTVSVTKEVYYKCLSLNTSYGIVRAFADEGSGFNFVEEGLIRRLKVPVIEGPAITALGLGRKSGQVHTKYVWLDLYGLKKITVRLLFCVIPKISYASFHCPPRTVIQMIPEEDRRYYWDDQTRPVEMMIGLTDYGSLIDKHHKITQGPDGTYSYQTSSLGTVIFGGLQQQDVSIPVHLTLCAEDLLQEDKDAEKPDSDRYVDQFLTEHVRALPGRIEVDVPMTGKFALASNSQRSLKQLKSNYFRWQKKGILSQVLNILQDWLKDGIIEPVPKDGQNDPRYHVLSYHTVIKLTSATTKIRLVFNGSLNDFLGRTLNDYLFKGHTTWSLVSSVLEFRLGRYPLAGDIRQAFLMVQLAIQDRNMFCFYWPQETDPSLFRFARVPFGTSSSPFLLYVAIMKIIQLEGPKHSELQDMIRRFYVDDLITSFDSLTDRCCLKEVCIKSFAKYGFNFGWSEEQVCGVLGLDWNSNDDTLSIRVPKLESPKIVRDLARIIPSIFDPAGWLEPPISALRRCFSDAWKSTKSGVIKSKNIIHVFSDANLSSIGVTVYLLVPGTEELRLVFAKSVLHRKRSVPEAELDALCLAGRLIHKHFSPDRFTINIWTDSLANYHRLHAQTINDLKYRQAIKVMKMREILEPYQAVIQHVVGKDNSADLMTKFETRKFDWDKFMTRQVPIATTVHSVQCMTSHIIEPHAEHDKILELVDKADTLEELLEHYELSLIIRTVQLAHWSKEIHAHLNGTPLPRKSSLGNYYYLMDGDLFCTKLRTDPGSVRIMIPSESPLPFLIWKYEHLKRAHLGTANMTSWYKSAYFTPRIRKLIYQWTSQCLYCANKRRRPITAPAAPLKRILRFQPGTAFTHCGLDFAGPYVTDKGLRHLLVINCFHSRAVFTHLLESTSSHALRCGLRLFVVRYQEPETMFSDNGKGIVKASTDIQKLYDLVPEATRGFKWTFSLPGDPATNGINEVMIGVTKNAMKGFHIPKIITEQELIVLVAEAEVVVNNRPLYVHNDEIITPNHFIYGRTTRPMIQPTKPVRDPTEHLHVQIRKRCRTYWNTWTAGYLDRRRDLQQGRVVDTLHPGDHVLYTEEKLDDQGQWPTAVVTHTHPSPDGTVRAVDIRMHDGRVHLRRSIRHLIRFSSEGAEAVAILPNTRNGRR